MDMRELSEWLTSRSREGAWIEIRMNILTRQGQQGRSREGAWIEMLEVHLCSDILMSLPRGSVD